MSQPGHQLIFRANFPSEANIQAAQLEPSCLEINPVGLNMMTSNTQILVNMSHTSSSRQRERERASLISHRISTLQLPSAIGRNSDHCGVSSAGLFTGRIKTLITKLKNTGEASRERRETTQREPADTASKGFQSARLELNISRWNTLQGPNIRPDTTV